MPMLSFYKMYPRISDMDRWAHPSAVWAERECPALRIYIGALERGPRPHSLQQWKAVADMGFRHPIPEWLQALVQEGFTDHLLDPDTTLLFPDQNFNRMKDVKTALQLFSDKYESRPPSVVTDLIIGS